MWWGHAAITRKRCPLLQVRSQVAVLWPSWERRVVIQRCDVLLTVVKSFVFLCAHVCVCVCVLKSDGDRHHRSTDSEMQSLAALFLEFQFLCICVDGNMPAVTAKHVFFFSASCIKLYGNRRLIAATVSLFFNCGIVMHLKVSQLT